MTDDVVTGEGAESSAPEAAAETPTWGWDENTPGVGERPEYLSSKFKSVAEAAKSYNALEKKLGTAPQEYNFDAAKSWLDPDFEPLQEAAAFAKEKHVSQEVMDKILAASSMYLEESTVSNEQEIAKLGDNASERLNVLNNWAKSNFSEGTFQALTNTMNTAEAVVAVEEIRNTMLSNTTNVPTSNDSSTNSAPSLEEVQSELNNNLEKYKNDAKYRKELSARLQNASGTSKFSDK